jgi:hypothetical protein
MQPINPFLARAVIDEISADRRRGGRRRRSSRA